MTVGIFADACALIAFYGASDRTLSPNGLVAMRTGAVAVSAITIWEITRKVSLGRLPALPAACGNDLPGYLRGEGFRLVPLSPEAAQRANALPPHHLDPMDRMLIATALAEGATVITNDGWFAAYGVPTLW